MPISPSSSITDASESTVTYLVLYMNLKIRFTLFISAFRRASDLATAMESRCYKGGEGRTKYKPLVYTTSDKLAYILLAVYVVVIIGLDILVRNVDALSFFIAK